MTIEKTEMRVDHFYSPMDEKIITKKMLDTPGVESCKALYRAGLVQVEYDPEQVSAESLQQKCTEAGYPLGEGLDGFWLDVACAILLVVLYIFIPKGLLLLGVNVEALPLPSAVCLVMMAAGLLLAVLALKAWGVLAVLNQLPVPFIDNIPKRYNKWVWKIGTLLCVLIALFLFNIGAINLP